MRDDAVAALFAALARAGAPARFVGGCVRDALLGRPAGDVDIATPLPPDRVAAALRDAGLKAVPTGIEHGTVTAVVPSGEGHRSFEVTTLRVDVETDGRHAVVAFTGDWRADAARRDFTMNALSAEPDGLLHDYFGGIADALAGRVRFVGDPARRLEEDRLRLLRFFRFQAHYGREPPDAAALAACGAYAPGIVRLAGERVRSELFKLMAAPDPVPVWRTMQAYDVAPYVLNGRAGDADRLAGLVRSEPEPDSLRRLAALWDGDAAETEALADRLRLSNEDRERLRLLAAERDAVDGAIDRRALRRLLYRVGRARGVDLVLLGSARTPDDPRSAALRAEADGWPEPQFPLKGRDVVEAGVAPGRRVGRLLDAVERWWIDTDFTADREACLAELRRRAAAEA
jgi:poly(A) polymerase